MKKYLAVILSIMIILASACCVTIAEGDDDGTVTMPRITIPTSETETTESTTAETGTTEAPVYEEPTEAESTTEEPTTEPESSTDEETSAEDTTLPEASSDYEATEIPFSEESTTVYNISAYQVDKVKAKSATPCQLRISWNRLSVRAAGYEVQYSTSASFTAATTKTVTVKGGDSTLVILQQLKGGTRYYVRVRAYYGNRDGGATTSQWSKTVNAVVLKK